MKRIASLLLCLAVAVGAYFITGLLTTDSTQTQGGQESSVLQDKDDPGLQPGSQDIQDSDPKGDTEYVWYYFRSSKLLNQHYEKHGKDMGFANAQEYEQAACDVINNPDALSKTEKEDGDLVFYVEDTNEFVVLSTDGYIRTYFWPDAGKKYYDKQ